MRFLRRGDSASTLDLLVAGLGNPGREYADTRHNTGFLVVDELARRHGGTFRSKFSGDLSELRIDGHRVALLKPRDVHERVRPLGPARGEVLQGRAGVAARRPRRGRSRAGTAAGAARRRPGGPQRPALGRKSLGTPEFTRLRIGVGRPERGDPRPVADWVLTPFTDDVDVDALVARSADAVETLLRDGLDQAQRDFN